MKIVTNGVMTEVIVLKHFNLDNEEYILYKNNNNALLGLINQSKILTPSQDRINLLMNIIGNIINNIPVNIEHNLTLLDNNIDLIYEEISYQIINVPQELINNTINNSNNVAAPNVVENVPVNNPVNNNSLPVTKKKNNTFIYIIIVVILLLGLLLFIFKDNIFGSSSSGNGGSGGNKKTIEGVEIVDGLKTYAIRVNTFSSSDGTVREYSELVVRYDNNGDFKYLKITTNNFLTGEDYDKYSDKELQEMLEKKCKNGEKMEYEDLEVVCKISNRVYSSGYIFTDKTISSEFFNSKYKDNYMLKSILRDFDKELKKEDNAAKWFNKMKEEVEDKQVVFIIMNNEKVY